MGARVSTGKDSKQDYGTPLDLFEACVRRFGRVGFDLAATRENARHALYFAPDLAGGATAYGIDAFAHSWAETQRRAGGLLWLNPPFAEIARWAERFKRERQDGARGLMLVPAALGANWFRDHVAGHAEVWVLNGRPSFIPGQTYNKDCMVCLYSPDGTTGVKVWNWREDVVHHAWKA